MPFDAHKNLAHSLVATAPSPATSGTSLVVTTGEGTRFPTGSFTIAIGPADKSTWTVSNVEFCRATISTDTMTLTRAQEGSAARTVVVGDRIEAGMTALLFTEIYAAINQASADYVAAWEMFTLATNYATRDQRNSIPVLDFDDGSDAGSADEAAYAIRQMPLQLNLTSGLLIDLDFMATTATTGNVMWEVAFARFNVNNQDLDSYAFDAVTLSSATATNGTSGKTARATISVAAADTDGVAAGEWYVLRIVRKETNGSDTMSGDAELIGCGIRSAA